MCDWIFFKHTPVVMLSLPFRLFIDPSLYPRMHLCGAGHFTAYLWQAKDAPDFCLQAETGRIRCITEVKVTRLTGDK